MSKLGIKMLNMYYTNFFNFELKQNRDSDFSCISIVGVVESYQDCICDITSYNMYTDTAEFLNRLFVQL